ncbi:MAG: DUF1573 domain-containing protein [Sphingobacteriales bacterium]|nr:MAG: DUF1573 domain-containing protein [Sphingobacteriales bacterium]
MQEGEKPALEGKGHLSADLVSNPRSAEGMDMKALDSMSVMEFKDTLHDFGNMKAGEVGDYDFEFTNTGKSPLIINNALGSCGCTVPDYPHEPIAPGKNGVIKVKFNSADKNGPQNKTVSLSTNSKRGNYMLFIKANVKGEAHKLNLTTE